MAVIAARGELGWAKLGSDDLRVTSLTPTDNPSYLIPPTLGNFYPLNYAAGITVPSVGVRTNVYSDFFTAAKFGAWFTSRDGNFDVTTCGTMTFYDGKSYSAYTGVLADSFTLEWMNGGLIDLSMTMLAPGTMTAGTVAATPGTTAPSRWADVAFGTATGVVRAALSYSNRAYPSGEMSTSGLPMAIHGGAPVFSLSLDQKANGVAPVTSEVITITPPGASAVVFTMKFRLTSGPDRVISYGETIYRRTYTGMRIAAADTPFVIT